MRFASASLTALCLSLLPLPSRLALASPVPLTYVPIDVDGDGRSDSVTVSIDGRVAVRRADGVSEALSFAELPPLASAFVEMWIGRAGARYLRIEGRPQRGGRLLLLAALRGGRLIEIHNGPIGPIGRDAEYSVEVKLEGGELLRYQTSPSVRRCDGESRLFLERYVEPNGFIAAPELTLPPPSERPLTTTTTAPTDLTAAPLGIYRYLAASAQAGIGRADMLTPPRELGDNSRATAWRITGDPRGAFVTAQSDGSGHAVRALRFDRAAANQGLLPAKLLLFFDDKQRLQVDLAATPPGAAQWLVLPEPLPSRCLSVAIVEGASKSAMALAEVAIYSELDGAAGAKSLVDRVARGSMTDAAGATRTLQELLRQSPPSGSEIVEATAALLNSTELPFAGRRRLEELLLLIGDSATLGNAPRARSAELLLFGLRMLSKADRTSRLAAVQRAGKFGEGVLSQLALDEKGAPEDRAEALALLRCLPDGHPTLAQAQAALLRSAPDAGTPIADDSSLKLGAALAQGLAQAQSGCGDVAARTQVAAALQTLFSRLPADGPTNGPPSGSNAAVNAALFVLRYRLLQGLERLATATPAVIALLNQVVTTDAEPVLRQTAARALVVLSSTSTPRELGLADRDAGVRLATLAALPSAMQGDADAALIAAIEGRLTGDNWPQVRRVAAEVRAAACAKKPPLPAPQIAALRKALGDADLEVQRLALLGLGRCEGSGAIDVLLRVAEGKGADFAPSLRGLGCALVARHGFAAPELDAALRARAHKAAAAALLDIFQDPSADERYAAALNQCMRGFGEAGDGGDLPVLFEVAGSDVPAPLRAAALRNITAICGRSAQPLSSSTRKGLAALLKTALGDADGKIVAEAKRAQATCH